MQVIVPRWTAMREPHCESLVASSGRYSKSNPIAASRTVVETLTGITSDRTIGFGPAMRLSIPMANAHRLPHPSTDGRGWTSNSQWYPRFGGPMGQIWSEEHFSPGTQNSRIICCRPLKEVYMHRWPPSQTLEWLASARTVW